MDSMDSNLTNLSPAVSASPLPVNSVPSEAVVQTQSIDNIQYAGFWRRWLAASIDGLIVGFASFFINFIYGFITGSMVGKSSNHGLATVGFINLVVYVLGIIYYVYFIGSKGQTFGKMAMKIKVVKKDTQEVPGYGSAFLRETIGKLISGIVLSLGFLWMLWDKEKQTWHDKMADTVVVKL